MSAARAANRVWDRDDMVTFDLIAGLPARAIDQALSELTTAELEALLQRRTEIEERT